MSYAEQLAAERKARLARMQSTVKPGPAMVPAEEYDILEGKFFKAQALIAELEEMLAKQRAALKAFADKDSAPTIPDVVAVVAKHFNVPKSAPVGRGRGLEITQVRHIAQYICRRFGYSLHQIGRAFGRDHTTVLHGSSQVMRRTGEPEYDAFIESLEAKVVDYAAERAGARA